MLILVLGGIIEKGKCSYQVNRQELSFTVSCLSIDYTTEKEGGAQ